MTELLSDKLKSGRTLYHHPLVTRVDERRLRAWELPLTFRGGHSKAAECTIIKTPFNLFLINKTTVWVNSGKWLTVEFIYPKLRFLCFLPLKAEQLVIHAKQYKEQMLCIWHALILNMRNGQGLEGASQRESVYAKTNRAALTGRKLKVREQHPRLLCPVCSWITAWLKIYWAQPIDRLRIYLENIWMWRYKYRIQELLLEFASQLPGRVRQTEKMEYILLKHPHAEWFLHQDLLLYSKKRQRWADHLYLSQKCMKCLCR